MVEEIKMNPANKDAALQSVINQLEDLKNRLSRPPLSRTNNYSDGGRRRSRRHHKKRRHTRRS